jgi:DNA polymerase-3 subunit beta
VIFAAAREEGKYAMRGVYWEVGSEGLTLVATDGKRLSVVGLGGPREKATALLPPKAMQILQSLCGDELVKVWLPKANGQAYFETGAALLSSRLVEGRFPPYRDVMPKKAKATVPLVAGTFYGAVRQAALMTDDESKRIEFAFQAGKVTLTAQGATTGKASVTHALPDYAGPDISISFDPSYLCDMLRVLDKDDTLQLDLVDGEKSAVFRAGEWKHLVVPLV